MRTDRQPVIGGVADDRILAALTTLGCVKNSADLGVKMFDQSVILSQLVADNILGPRPASQVLIANDQSTVVKRVLRQKIRRKRRSSLFSATAQRLLRLAWIVRGSEGNVGESTACRTRSSLRTPQPNLQTFQTKTHLPFAC